MSVPRLLLAGFCVLFVANLAFAESRPVAVSPGSPAGALIEGRCPTFNWGAVAGARSYQLVVYQLIDEESGEEARPVIRAAVPGSALGWTPALVQCLERGRRYAWSVRAMGRERTSDWSVPALFEVATPTIEEFEEALTIVRSYLATQDRAPSEPPAFTESEPAAEADPEPEGLAGPPGVRAAAPTALTVGQGVVAASFTGDGSALTDLDPANLSAGTAAIDISGNAATATTADTAWDLSCLDCVTESELDFVPSTQVELDAHKVSGDHDGAYVNTAGDAMVGALDMSGNIITDVGAAGTDFTATGGLTLADDLSLAQGETISNATDEVIRFSDGADTFDIDLSGSLSLVSGDGVVDVPGTLRAINDNAASLRLRGVCDEDGYSGDDAVFGSTCQSYAGLFYSPGYSSLGGGAGAGARTTRAIYGSNPGMDLVLQGSNHIQIVAVDDLGGIGKVIIQAEDEIEFHAFDPPYGPGGGNAESRNLIGVIDSSGLAVTGTVTATTLSGDGSGLTGLSASSLSTGTLAAARGGLGFDASGAGSGSLLYTSAPGTWSSLPAGADGQVLKLAAGAPSWGSDLNSGGTVTELTGDTGIVLTPSSLTTTGTIGIDTAVVPQLGTANTFSASQTVQTGGAANTGLAVEGAPGQSSALQVWRDSTQTTLAEVGPAGGIVAASFAGDGSGLTSVTAADLDGAATVSTSELDFDPATQTELDSHQGTFDAHHAPTVDTNTTCDGWPCDGTNFTNLDWDNLVDLPAGFDDDIDDDTTYTAGPGLVLSGVQFSLGTHHAVPMDNVTSTVDGTSLVGKYSSITIGADGLPVISYDGAGSLEVAHCNDAACSGGDETLSTVDSSSGAGLFTSIAIDADGLPVISYRYLGGLRMVRCNDIACSGGDEVPNTLHSVSPPPGRTSIAIGADGLPVISYYEQDNDDLNVIHCNDASCSGGDESLSTVDSTGDVGDYSSIAIGADGLPVISYYDSDNTALKVAHCDDVACSGGGETLSTVDNTGTVGEYSSIAIGTDGLPVISYRGAGLKVAHCNDVACSGSDETLSTVDSDGNAGLDTSITIGADALPVISYKNFFTGAVRLAHCNDVACSGGNESLYTVHQAGTASQHTSITIGADGLPVISFEQMGLKVVRCASAFCVPYFRRR